MHWKLSSITLGFHIALPQNQIPQMPSWAELAKVGPLSQMRLQTWCQNTPPFGAQCLLIVRFGANCRIQVQFQPLVGTLSREGELQPGAWAWVLCCWTAMSYASPEVQYSFSVADRNCTILYPRQYRVFSSFGWNAVSAGEKITPNKG